MSLKWRADFAIGLLCSLLTLAGSLQDCERHRQHAASDKLEDAAMVGAQLTQLRVVRLVLFSRFLFLCISE